MMPHDAKTNFKMRNTMPYAKFTVYITFKEGVAIKNNCSSKHKKMRAKCYYCTLKSLTTKQFVLVQLVKLWCTPTSNMLT